MNSVGVLTSTGPSYPLSRGPRLQRVHCSVAAAILGRGSRKVVRESFLGKLCSKVDRCGLYSAVYSPITSLEVLRPPVVIMAGFKLRAWIVVRERRTTRAAPLVPGEQPFFLTHDRPIGVCHLGLVDGLVGRNPDGLNPDPASAQRRRAVGAPKASPSAPGRG
ncbi:hypothetical protein NDU88_006185 [Pleurodeles waltl]|uniref:Uncharacterized protein n=1 Tax=Pleurodeles waltl TaxID=8319 RepID=A0AAV7PK58_PLEWA|nr:hypothetical protein NDU88_006185 [Pleurodeles waltl]